MRDVSLDRRHILLVRHRACGGIRNRREFHLAQVRNPELVGLLACEENDPALGAGSGPQEERRRHVSDDKPEDVAKGGYEPGCGGSPANLSDACRLVDVLMDEHRRWARDVVALWPAWKRTILERSGEPTMSQARPPVDNREPAAQPPDVAKLLLEAEVESLRKHVEDLHRFAERATASCLEAREAYLALRDWLVVKGDDLASGIYARHGFPDRPEWRKGRS